MGAGWIAGSVRARLLLERRFGSETALAVAGAGSLDEALGLASVAGLIPDGQGATLERAQRGVAASLALQVRLLAAWIPRDSAGGLRALASWFELVNMEDRLATFVGVAPRTPYELGMLSSVWAAAAETQSPDELRRVLARSSWGDPGSDDIADIHLALRLAWARRVASQVPDARPWAAGAVAILLAGELFLAGRPVDEDLVRRAALGGAWRDAASPADLRRLLPPFAAWALEGVDDVAELWRAELMWWRRVVADAERLAHGRLDRGDVVLGTVALLAFDAVLLTVALGVAARDGSASAREVLDALC
jgi:hypothetical protein